MARSIVKTGCVGCTGVLAILGLIAVFLVVAPFLVDRPAPDPVQERLAPDLPGFRGDPESTELGAVEMPEGPAAARSEAWTLRLDLSMGRFRIEPAPPGSSLEVEAEFDRGSFELSERIDESDRTYTLSFGPTSSLWSFIGMNRNDRNEVVVRIPVDRPFALVGDVGIGETRANLSGMWLTEVNLELGIGDHHFELEEPTREPMDLFALESSVGEISVVRLGYGSPERVRLEQGVGEMLADLRGPWTRDAVVDVDMGVGELNVRVPENVHIEADLNVGVGETDRRGVSKVEIPDGAPTLTLRAQGGVGEVEIRRVPEVASWETERSPGPDSPTPETEPDLPAEAPDGEGNPQDG